jgi:hypothetical protein
MEDIALSGGCAANIEDAKMYTMIRNKETNTFPSILHWNGGSKSAGTMQPILQHLNLL